MKRLLILTLAWMLANPAPPGWFGTKGDSTTEKRGNLIIDDDQQENSQPNPAPILI